MKKISVTLLFVFTAIIAAQAQSYSDPFQLSIGPQASYPPQLNQDDNTSYVGIGIASASGGSQFVSALTVGNQAYSSPSALTAVMQVVNTVTSATDPSVPGASAFSFGVVRAAPGYLNNCTDADLVVENTGYVGIGAPASYLYPSGAHFGIYDPDNSDNTPLVSIWTNTNFVSGYNLPALGIDYSGYVNIGAVMPVSSFTTPAHLLVTDPNITGADPLVSVVTNLAHSSAQALYIDATGAVGIGTTSFDYYKTNGGAAEVNPDLYVATHGGDAALLIHGGDNTGTNGYWPTMGLALTNTSSAAILGASIQGVITNSSAGTESMDLAFTTKPSDGAATKRMTITSTGSVVIGTVSSTPSGYNLYVQNGILTEKAKVAVSGTSDWSDYVFDKDYKLTPLSDVDTYIKDNKHLPGVPSAADVVCDGIDLGAMDATLLKKIEELTLYMFNQQKEIESLKGQLAQNSKK